MVGFFTFWSVTGPLCFVFRLTDGGVPGTESEVESDRLDDALALTTTTEVSEFFFFFFSLAFWTGSGVLKRLSFLSIPELGWDCVAVVSLSTEDSDPELG